MMTALVTGAAGFIARHLMRSLRAHGARRIVGADLREAPDVMHDAWHAIDLTDPAAVRRLKGAVVANQLNRLGSYEWRAEDDATAEPVGDRGVTGWRSRVRLDTSPQGRAGFHRYHSAELVTDLNCAQLHSGMLDGINDWHWPHGAHVHVAIDDAGDRHVVQSGPREGRKTATHVIEG